MNAEIKTWLKSEPHDWFHLILGIFAFISSLVFYFISGWNLILFGLIGLGCGILLFFFNVPMDNVPWKGVD